MYLYLLSIALIVRSFKCTARGFLSILQFLSHFLYSEMLLFYANCCATGF